MKRLGVTGGIGAGKSFVSRVLTESFGIPVYDCDARAKALMNSSEDVRQALTRLIGPQAYGAQGRLCREAVAAYLFASEAHAQRVNAIVHPAVRRDFRCWCGGQTADVVALESAILFECGFEDEVDEVLFVDAPRETRLRRAMVRDGADRAQVEARMARQ
ncbi:MAG: dephospho-CoA kinase, partial [Bacteroidaceae bacterium]|nr:dephospho-CoA kinase [Bacteroidaceae bacterium]